MGKKRKYTETVGVLFKKETLNQLQRVTDELEKSNSEFIRELVEKELSSRIKNGKDSDHGK